MISKIVNNKEKYSPNKTIHYKTSTKILQIKCLLANRILQSMLMLLNNQIKMYTVDYFLTPKIRGSLSS